MQLNIRPVRESDLDAITDIYNDEILTSTSIFFVQPLDIRDRQAWLNNLQKDNYPCIVVEIDTGEGAANEHVLAKRTIGWCNLSRYKPREAYNATAEISLYIHKAFRGCGIGGRLLGSMVPEARRLGFHTIIGLVTAENEATCRFWEKQGFEKCGLFRQVGRKFERWLDTVAYQLILGNTSETCYGDERELEELN